MAGFGDDADYDFEDEYGYDEDYIYAEDSWGLADELAANALPQPTFEVEMDDYDMYDYWEDLEYGNDTMHDGNSSDEDEREKDKTGTKRKRATSSKAVQADKRKRIAGPIDYSPVLWMPLNEAFNLDEEGPILSTKLKPYALLSDWRERMKKSSGFAIASADSDQEMEDEAEGWEDLSEGSEDEQEMDDLIDQEVLKKILADKLGSGGISSEDQGAFMTTLMQMLAGGEEQEDMIENLTKTLLQKVGEEGDDSGMTQWLSQQGVTITEEEDPDEEEHDEDVEGNTDDMTQDTTKSVGKIALNDSSPKDSVAGKSSVSENDRATATSAPNMKTSPAESLPKSRKRKQTAPKSIAQIEQNLVAQLDSELPSAAKRAKRTQTPPVPTTKSAKDSITSGDTKPNATGAVAKTKETKKRKAAVEEPADQPARKVRNFAAPTASSQRKVSEPTTRTTRSTRQNK